MRYVDNGGMRGPSTTPASIGPAAPQEKATNATPVSTGEVPRLGTADTSAFDDDVVESGPATTAPHHAVDTAGLTKVSGATFGEFDVDEKDLKAETRAAAAAGYQRLHEAVTGSENSSARATGTAAARHGGTSASHDSATNRSTASHSSASTETVTASHTSASTDTAVAGTDTAVTETGSVEPTAEVEASPEETRHTTRQSLLTLFDRPGIDEAFRAELGAPEAPADGASVSTDAPKPPALMREAAQAKAEALTSLLRDPETSPGLRDMAIERLGIVGGKESLELLAPLAEGTDSTAATARDAMAAIEKAQKLDIVLVSWEVKGFVNSGGLANVSREYAEGLAKAGHKVTVISPLHEIVDKSDLKVTGEKGMVAGPGGSERFHLRTKFENGVDWVNVENDKHLSTNGASLYPDEGKLERFDFFSAAIPNVLAVHRGPNGGAPDILHVNDSHAAAAVAYVKESGFFPGTKTVYQVHNNGEAYQGRFRPDQVADTRLDGVNYFRHGDGESAAENYGDVVLSKVGLVESDAVVAVSASETANLSAPGSNKLAGVFQMRDARGEFYGCLNGIDPVLWGPSTDPFLPPELRFEPGDAEGKAKVRGAVQEQFGLAADPDSLVVGFACRIDAHQKAMDEVIGSARESLSRGDKVQFVVCGDAGSGDPALVAQLRELSEQFPGRFAYDGEFKPAKEHLILAGADALGAASRYEPCGLPDKYCKAYDTVTLGRDVGGIAEGTVNFDPDTGTGDGILFQDFSEGLSRLLTLKNERPEAYGQMVGNARARDFRWESTAVPEMVAIYRETMGRKREPGV